MKPFTSLIPPPISSLTFRDYVLSITLGPPSITFALLNLFDLSHLHARCIHLSTSIFFSITIIVPLSLTYGCFSQTLATLPPHSIFSPSPHGRHIRTRRRKPSWLYAKSYAQQFEHTSPSSWERTLVVVDSGFSRPSGWILPILIVVLLHYEEEEAEEE